MTASSSSSLEGNTSSQGKGGDGDSKKSRKRRRRMESSPVPALASAAASAAAKAAAGLHPSPSSSPSFLDATAAVSVATFGSRRLPELERLYSKIVSSPSSSSPHGTTIAKKKNSNCVVDVLQPYRSGGGKSSSRHLRRRTTSIKTRKHYHRYPSVGQTSELERRQPKWQGRSRKSRRKKSSLLMEPHTQWLLSTRKRQVMEAGEDNAGNDDDGMRKTHETKQQQSRNPAPDSNTTEVSTTAVNWLTTHLWHTKRCHIHNNLWGWNVPMMHTNRGPRAALRLSKSDDQCILRDVSWENQPVMYIQVVQLQQQRPTTVSMTATTTAMIQKVLKNLARVSPHLAASSLQQQATQGDKDAEKVGVRTQIESFVHGLSILECHLYEVDQFPNAAIGPVTWRLVTFQHSHDEQDGAAGSSVVIEIRCHPSLRSSVSRCLADLIDAANNDNGANSTEKHDSTTTYLEWKQVNDSTKNSDAPTEQPRVCFRLYGRKSTRLLNEIFDLGTVDEEEIYLNQQERKQSRVVLDFLRQDRTSYDSSQKGTTNANTKTTTEGLFYDGMIAMVKVILKNNPIATSHFVEKDESDRKADLPSNHCQLWSSRIMLVYRSPRSLDCEANRAVSGWDIFCYCGGGSGGCDKQQSFLHALWMKLVLNNCCVIGLVEDIHLKLECEPPIPIFPRDFVDTYQSQIYWKGRTFDTHDGSSIGAIQTNVQQPAILKDWLFVRHQFEGGWGRVRMHVTPTRTKYQQHVDFCSLVKTQQDETATNVVSLDEWDNIDAEGTTSTVQQVVDPIVVRGDFLTPFFEALHSCGRIPTTKYLLDDSCINEVPSHHGRRRKRRNGSSEKACVFSEKLSNKEREPALAQYHLLLSSLSLPAALLVHVRLIGEGTIDPGMFIHGCDFNKNCDDDGDDDGDDGNNYDDATDRKRPLGRITAGSFSPSRGVCHGIGVVSAASMLSYLTRCCNNESQGGMLVRLINGTKSLQLSVMVGSRRRRLNPACISLIPTV